MNIVEYLVANWDSALIIAAVLAVVIVSFRKGEMTLLKHILFRLVTRAEQEFGGGTGELKKAAVIEWLYERIPAVIRLIVSPKAIETMIDDVLAYAKEKWAANPKLQEYIEGIPPVQD